MEKIRNYSGVYRISLFCFSRLRKSRFSHALLNLQPTYKGVTVMYAVIKNLMNGDKKVVYKTADLLQARDYAESLNEDFDDPDGAHYTVGMIKENG